MSMERAEYLKIADACLERVTNWLEGFDPDELDFNEADGVLNFVFADGTRFVLNRQSAADQMWFAAGARAWHYDWKDGEWVDDRDGHRLYDCIGKVVSEKLGRGVEV